MPLFGKRQPDGKQQTEREQLMATFGIRSAANLATAHPSLQRLFREVIKHFDCSVICGHRTEEEQNKVFHEGKSKVQWPRSKHNRLPSIAVDVVPYPVDWKDTNRFYYFAGVVKGIASSMDIDIRWGGDWDGDTQVHDQTFMDLPHFELK